MDNNYDSPFEDHPDDEFRRGELFGPTSDSHNQRSYLEEHVLRDRDPDGCPYTTLDQKWKADGDFSNITTHLTDLEAMGTELNTTPAFRALEVGARVLDSRFGGFAAGVIFGGLAAIDRVKQALSRTPAFGHESITTPVAANQTTDQRNLQTHVQRASYLNVTAVSEGQPDLDHIRANTLATSLLSDVRTIVNNSQEPTSFSAALDIATTACMQTVDEFRTETIINLARDMVAQRFEQVGVEASLAQISTQVA
jgi:hypothetical protein